MVLDSQFQLLPGAKRHDTACGDRNLLASLGIASGPLILVAQVEVAEPRQLHRLPPLERLTQHLEKGVHAFPGFTLVEAHVEKQALGHLCLGQRHVHFLNLAPNSLSSSLTASATLWSASSSVSVRESSCKIKPIARLFRPTLSPGPRKQSNSTTSFKIVGKPERSVAAIRAHSTPSSTSIAMSRRKDGKCASARAVDMCRCRRAFKSTSKTWVSGRSSCRCRAGCRAPITPATTPSRSTRAPRPGCSQPGRSFVSNDQVSSTPDNPISDSRSPLMSWKSSARFGVPHCSARALPQATAASLAVSIGASALLLALASARPSALAPAFANTTPDSNSRTRACCRLRLRFSASIRPGNNDVRIAARSDESGLASGTAFASICHVCNSLGSTKA